MKLAVYVLGRQVATLESLGDFRSAMTYRPDVAEDHLVSLTMPVRATSYMWDDQLPPVFQMNLPEGYLLKVLQEAFGPTVGASPASLLAVVGRTMVGRLQVAAPGANLEEAATPLEVQALLDGDNAEAAFAQLVRAYATSGVSGVLPKFLSAEAPPPVGAPSEHSRATLVSRFHIVKGASAALPFVTLNEHLCMEVARRVLPTAETQISRDGQALAVRRFDVDDRGRPVLGMEDFCALLGMRPAAKYDTTWERVAKAVRQHVRGEARAQAMQHLAAMLVLTLALRNADCHAKNLALLYTSRADARLAPVYDMCTTTIYEGFQHNPPALSLMGRKTWRPGRSLHRFCATTLGLSVRQQALVVEQICDAVADVWPLVQAERQRTPGFAASGLRMLHAWADGVASLREARAYALPPWRHQAHVGALPEAPALQATRDAVVGPSELLGRRR